MTEQNASETDPKQRVLLTGATGYVGSRLLPQIEGRNLHVRCLVRTPEKLTGQTASATEICKGDVLDPDSLVPALSGVHTAYYFVHLMGVKKDFQLQDRTAAENFAAAAKAAQIQRIIYLGGLGETTDPNLSSHLRSRHEVGQILRESGIETIEFRASVIIGNGSLSFDLIRSLTNRLPIMICPSWLSTPTQPIAIKDVLAYLLAALDLPESESQIYEIGCRDVVTYGELIQEYARIRGLRRWLISVPVLTPYLSSLWLGLVTPASAEVGRHLVEGLRNPTIVRDQKAQTGFSIQPSNIQEAIRDALNESSP